MARKCVNQTLLATAFPLAFRYVNRNRQIHDVEAVVVRVEFTRTDGGNPRVTLRARDTSDASGPVKSYYLHRMAEIIDQETGEVLQDTIGAFSTILSDLGGHQPPEWPVVRIRRRSTTSFEGPNETAESWAFQVPAAFRAALDILWTQETKKVEQTDGSTATKIVWEGWTEGFPPALAFSQGDSFHAPANVVRTRWADQLKAMTHLIQVEAARACSAEDATDAGEVTLAVYRVRDGTLGPPTRLSMTQTGLRDVLRDGRLPDGARI